MPTSIARIGPERDLAALARSLFVIEGENRAELQRAAERALLRDNPQLTRAEAFADGNLVVVPAVAGLRVSTRVSSGQTGIEGLLDQALARLGQLTGRIDQGLAAAETRRAAALARVDDRAFRGAVRDALPGGAELLAAAGQAIREQAEAERSRGQALRVGAEAAIAEIGRLRERLPSPGPDAPPGPGPGPERPGGDPTGPRDPSRPVGPIGPVVGGGLLRRRGG